MIIKLLPRSIAGSPVVISDRRPASNQLVQQKAFIFTQISANIFSPGPIVPNGAFDVIEHMVLLGDYFVFVLNCAYNAYRHDRRSPPGLSP